MMEKSCWFCICCLSGRCAPASSHPCNLAHQAKAALQSWACQIPGKDVTMGKIKTILALEAHAICASLGAVALLIIRILDALSKRFLCCSNNHCCTSLPSPLRARSRQKRKHHRMAQAPMVMRLAAAPKPMRSPPARQITGMLSSLLK